MSRRPDFSFTLDDFRRDDSTRKRATTSLQSGGTVLEEFSSASDLLPHHDDDVDSKKDLPKLPNGNNKKFCCILWCCFFTCYCLVPASLIGIAYVVAPDAMLGLLPAALHEDAATSTDNRAVRRDETVRDHAELGLWDSQQRATPLQMQVALSQALGVRADDEDVSVAAQQNRHFFEIHVQHATQEEVVFMDTPVFLASLNAHLSQFGASAVVTHSPRLVKAGDGRGQDPDPTNPTNPAKSIKHTGTFEKTTLSVRKRTSNL